MKKAAQAPDNNQRFSATNERILRWLTSIPCRAPCWEGIIPGRTTFQAARQMLQQNKFVDQSTFPSTEGGGEIDWWWADSRFGMGIIRHTNDVVDFILVDMPEAVILRDMMLAYGEPSHIVAYKFSGYHGEGPFYLLSLIYKPQGFLVETAFLYDKKPSLSEELPFHKVYFSAAPENLVSGELGAAGVVPWEGFKDISYYCRDTEDGRLCAEDR